MTNVTIIGVEQTPFGEMAEMIVVHTIDPSVGMILIDEDSQTWEITGTLHDSRRTTGDDKHVKLWTIQCKPVNTEAPLHTGAFKMMH